MTANQDYNHKMAQIKFELDRLFVAFYKLDTPRDTQRDWAEAGDAGRLLSEIKSINERLYKEGEYA